MDHLGWEFLENVPRLFLPSPWLLFDHLISLNHIIFFIAASSNLPLFMCVCMCTCLLALISCLTSPFTILGHVSGTHFLFDIRILSQNTKFLWVVWSHLTILQTWSPTSCNVGPLHFQIFVVYLHACNLSGTTLD